MGDEVTFCSCLAFKKPLPLHSFFCWGVGETDIPVLCTICLSLCLCAFLVTKGQRDLR